MSARNHETRLESVCPAIPRNGDGSIDYQALGAQLECDCNGAELAAFARRFGASTDGAMRSLATFALFLCTAKCERLAGRIDAAQLAEMNAETVYQRDILAANRW